MTLPGREVAAKTGTTQNWHDGWTMGFTPSLAAGAWAGNNCGGANPKCLMKEGADGVFVAAPIWNQFMKEALKDKPAERFKEPPGITRIIVDATSGKLPTANSPSTKEEVFADYNRPQDYDNIHISLAYDSLTNLPADPTTPPERITYKNFTVFQSEQPQNPGWENPVRDWAIKNGYLYPSRVPTNPTQPGFGEISARITSPSDGQQIEFAVFVI